ncbi:MAG: ShlB/FhaC/HecB family hemolysin secretion/activation protein [Myxococcota bacterium]|nr:ShlB/FhaC/HecB family hemolysin secretion/activation protein [Myxococcales bacterium]
MRGLRGLGLVALLATAGLGPRVGLLCASASSAQSLPSGSGLPIERERPSLPAYEDEDEAPGLERPPESTPSPGTAPFAAGPGVLVRAFRIVGSTIFSDRELAAVVAPWTARVLHAEDLPQVTDALTRLYVEAGYVSSGAFVPDQTLEDGTVEIRIVEGHVERVELAPGGRLGLSFVEPRLRRGLAAPLDIDRLERALRLLQTDPRIARVDAVLLPGEARGSSVVRLAIEEARSWDLTLRVANDLAPSLGANRANARFVHRNVAGFGDTFRASVSGARGLFDLDLGYALPVTPWLTELELTGGLARGEVVEGPFQDDGFRNELEDYGAWLAQPLWRTLEDEVRLVVGFERRSSRLSVDSGLPVRFETSDANASGSRIRLSLLRLEASWLHRGPDHVSALRLRTTQGLDVWDATSPNSITPSDGVPALPDGEFTSWLLQLQHARRVPTWLGDGELVARADAQMATGALFSIESFALGGASTVRGYRENAVVADGGAVGSIELRVPVLPTSLRPHELRVAPFFDVGFAWDTHDRDAADYDDWLAGIGFGLLYRYADRFELNAYWGRALRRPQTGEGGDLQGHGFHLEGKVFVF